MTVGADQAGVITFRASLKDGIEKAIGDIGKKIDELRGERVKAGAKIGAIIGGAIGGAVLAVGSAFAGVVFASGVAVGLTGAALAGPAVVPVAIGLAVALAVCGIFAGIGALAGLGEYSLSNQLKEYGNKVDRLRAMSSRVDSVSEDACREAIAKLEEMDGAGSEKEKDALAAQAFGVIEREIIGGGVEADDRAKIMKETWAAYKKKLAEQAETNIA